MDPHKSEVAYEFLPYFRAYKDGHVERFFGTDVVPVTADFSTDFSCKDVLISLETGVSARLFKPRVVNPHRRLPIVIYFHGGAFCFGSPFCFTYHHHLATLMAESQVIAVSVDYQLAPEHPVPAAYDDAWTTLQWVASHGSGEGPESWLNDAIDLNCVFVAGDSAGGNIAHNVALRAGLEGLAAGVKLNGACLVHPGFANKERCVHESWYFVCSTTTGSDDSWINPSKDPRLSKLGCSSVLICIAEKDELKDADLFYGESLEKSGWSGEVVVVESPSKEHVFHLFDPNCENTITLLKSIASFLNQEHKT